MKFAMFARPVVTIYDLPETTKESDAGVVSTIGDEGLYGQVCQVRTEPGGVTADGITLPETMAEVVTFLRLPWVCIHVRIVFLRRKKELRGISFCRIGAGGPGHRRANPAQGAGRPDGRAGTRRGAAPSAGPGSGKPHGLGQRWGWWMAAAAMSGMWRWNRCAFR